MYIGICDDNSAFCEMLRKILYTEHFIQKDDQVQIFHSAQEILQQKHPIHFDILFLDIKMPVMSGTQLLHQYSVVFETSRVVLLTAFSEFATECYEYNAYRYLLKPLKKEKLQELFDAVHREEVLEQNIEVHVHTGKDVKIRMKDIVYSEVYNNYVHIKTQQKEEWISYMRLKDLLAALPQEYFQQTHKSYFVNMNYIVDIDYKEKRIRLKNGAVIPLSSARRKEFKIAYIQFLLKYK